MPVPLLLAGRLHHTHPAQSPQGQEEHPQVWAGAPVLVPCPNLSFLLISIPLDPSM